MNWVVNQLPGCTGFEPALRLEAAFADNPIHRPVENAPDGNRTHASQIALGVLSQLNYGTSHKASHHVRYHVGAVLRRARHMHGSANSDGQVA